MATERKYLKDYRTRREAEAFVDGLVAAGWLAAQVETVEEATASRWGVQYVVYHRVEKPDAPPVTPRRRFVR